jgi:hypothetical protein
VVNQVNSRAPAESESNKTHRLHCWQKRRSWPATTTRGHLVWASQTRCLRWYPLTPARSSPHPSTWHLTSSPPPSSPLARFPSRSFPPRRASASPEEPEAGAADSLQSQSSGGEEGDAAGFGTIHSMARIRPDQFGIRGSERERERGGGQQYGLWKMEERRWGKRLWN